MVNFIDAKQLIWFCVIIIRNKICLFKIKKFFFCCDKLGLKRNKNVSFFGVVSLMKKSY